MCVFCTILHKLEAMGHYEWLHFFHDLILVKELKLYENTFIIHAVHVAELRSYYEEELSEVENVLPSKILTHSGLKDMRSLSIQLSLLSSPYKMRFLMVSFVRVFKL